MDALGRDLETTRARAESFKERGDKASLMVMLSKLIGEHGGSENAALYLEQRAATFDKERGEFLQAHRPVFLMDLLGASELECLRRAQGHNVRELERSLNLDWTTKARRNQKGA